VGFRIHGQGHPVRSAHRGGGAARANHSMEHQPNRCLPAQHECHPHRHRRVHGTAARPGRRRRSCPHHRVPHRVPRAQLQGVRLPTIRPGRTGQRALLRPERRTFRLVVHPVLQHPVDRRRTADIIRYDGAAATGSNPTGRANQVHHDSTGRYRAILPGAQFAADTRYTQISAFGTSGPTRCSPERTRPVADSLEVAITCYRIAAASTPQPVDSPWLLTYVDGVGLHHQAAVPAAYLTTTGDQPHSRHSPFIQHYRGNPDAHPPRPRPLPHRVPHARQAPPRQRPGRRDRRGRRLLPARHRELLQPITPPHH
jgi:hypothetical protein